MSNEETEIIEDMLAGSSNKFQEKILDDCASGISYLNLSEFKKLEFGHKKQLIAQYQLFLNQLFLNSL